MQSLSSGLVKMGGKLLVGLRVRKPINAWDVAQSLRGVRMTVIIDEVGLVLLHTPRHVPLLEGLHREYIMQALNAWRDYLEPLPTGVTLSIINNVSTQFIEVRINDIPQIETNVAKALTLCGLGNTTISYSLFLRGSGGSGMDVLSCSRKAPISLLRRNIDALLRPSPPPGSMVMTRYYPIDIDMRRHLIVLGATGSGKTTLVRNVVNTALTRGSFNKVVIFDMTGEYSLFFVGRGYVAVPGVDIAVNPLALPRHRASELLAVAVQAASYIYNEDNEGFSFIQLEILEKALERLASNDIHDLYRVLTDLEQEYRRNDYLNAIAAVRRRIRRLMVKALMRTAISNDALKSRLLIINTAPLYYLSQAASIVFILTFLEMIRGRLRNALVVIDEAHRILGKYVVGETIIEKLIREGRHDNITFILITQNPLDIKRNVLDIVGHYAVFKLNGKSSMEASSLVGVNAEDLIRLRPLEFYYHDLDFTVKAYLLNNDNYDYARISRAIYEKMLDRAHDVDYVRAMVKRFGRALDPVILPQVLDLGNKLGYDVKSLIELAMKGDPEYMGLLSRVIMGED
ncbi:MAG: ATP-binding protein [Vulcanisaeta sp.]|nr:ATP-binding protein [Vulcanisaeta sp.]